MGEGGTLQQGGGSLERIDSHVDLEGVTLQQGGGGLERIDSNIDLEAGTLQQGDGGLERIDSDMGIVAPERDSQNDAHAHSTNMLMIIEEGLMESADGSWQS